MPDQRRASYGFGDRPAETAKAGAVDGPLLVNNTEINAAAGAISRDYGKVIGENQARNIAYIALVAARMAWITAAKEASE